MTRIQKKDYLYDSIRGLIANAKAQIVRNINTTIIFTYYEIGRVIVQDEQNGKYRADYAKKVLIKLSAGAGERLNVLDNRFVVEMTYYLPEDKAMK